MTVKRKPQRAASERNKVDGSGTLLGRSLEIVTVVGRVDARVSVPDASRNE
jgi:hypothetical protein